MVKIEGKNTAGLMQERDRMVVNPQVTASKGHRRSLTHDDDRPLTKVKDLGNVESKAMLWIPCRFVEVKSLSAPTSCATPHPPLSFPTSPECMAAWQMNESPR